MTQETPERPPIRRTARDTITEYGSISDDLLVATIHAETDAPVNQIREIIDRMEKHGAIYQAGNSWKVTKP